MFLAGVLPRHSFTASGLWSLLATLLAPGSVRGAVHALGLPFGLETVYHLLARLRARLEVLRSRLVRREKEPPSAQVDPLRHTLEHLQKLFPQGCCPVSEFQLAFQQPFLG